MNRPINIIWRRYVSALASLVAVCVLSVVPCHAQYGPPYNGPGQPGGGYQGYGPGGGFPGYGPGGGYPGNGQYGQPGGNPYQQGYQGGQNGGGRFGGNGRFGGQNNNNNALTLPQGIDQLYALQSDNSLMMFGTKEGYDTALEIVRNIDGDLDIIRTQVSLVKTSRATLAKLGVTLTGDTLAPSDIAKLVTARQAGDLRVSDVLRITTREDTVVDGSLGGAGSTEVPVTIVPRVTKDGRVAVEFNQPLSTTFTSPSGQTTAALLFAAGTADDSLVSLLFITPTILPSDYRPAR